MASPSSSSSAASSSSMLFMAASVSLEMSPCMSCSSSPCVRWLPPVSSWILWIAYSDSRTFFLLLLPLRVAVCPLLPSAARRPSAC
eukprot:1187965-Pyramimonas_sp.AAC.1